MIHFSPTERKLLTVLEDGKPHCREDLYSCIDDQLSNMPICLNGHISRMRRKMEGSGKAIPCILIQGRVIGYQLVRLLHSSVDGLT